MPDGAQPASRSPNATPSGMTHPGAVLTGIFCATTSFATFALHDAVIKWVVADYSPWQVLFTRSAVILTVYLAPQTIQT